MKATVDRIEKNTVLLEVEVDQEQFSQALNDAYRKVVKNVNIPGFRKGKAPKRVIERYFGKEALYNEAVEAIIPDAYMKAVEEQNIFPIDQPQMELVQVEEGKPVIFKATVTVKPEVELGQYTDLELVRPVIEVAEEDLAKELEALQNRYAKLINLDEGQVQDGDTVIMDFVGKADGEEFAGGKAQDYSLQIGSSSFIAGFEEQMVGMSSGETKEINVTFPQDYHAENLAAKDAVFTVTVKTIKRKDIAPLDDEFAKDVSEFDTLEELKEDLLNKLKLNAETQVQQSLEDQAVDKVVANAEAEIPEVMINAQIDDMMSNMEHRLMAQKVSLDDYLKFTNSSREQMRAELRVDAEKAVKTSLVLEAIGKALSVEATEEEVNEAFENLSKQYNQDAEILRKIMKSQGRYEVFVEGIQREKTVKLIIEKSNIVEQAAAE
ncbi:trigger factor [Desulfofarcimen acetoxidans DSM 771]|uniref:Trigger factor n=1 Tax=Desulfofarcimen acetoxidans (strain ATCC 49208 / DSM 771 / KCTC 5769 / VKM B-1644 / 5575) TaxID=485916 RepID=C8W5T6_DESAS|nr:trigger factor [Desulfofarcimen acetoxidans]ACV64086.1 trigger factor [Desulfofarcimen acetoxidans DSM 771]